MVTGKVITNLTAKEILNRISESDIYRYYLGEDFKLGEAFNSPMPGRRDNHPSFLIGCRGGFLYHIDFADDKFKGNCFQFVMQKEMLPNYNSALRRIERDFNLGITSIPSTERERPVFTQVPLIETKPKFFQVKYTSRFTLEELRYWEQFYITPKELKDNEIFAVRKFLIDWQVQPMRLGELTFGYRLGSLWKIYRPYACKDRKWKTNIPIDGVENLEALKGANKGLVAKARKDRIILSKFLPTVCSVQNESVVALNEQSALFLQENCNEVYITYDSDPPGKKKSLELTGKYGFKHLNVPDNYLAEGIKDFGDLIKVYGPDVVYKYLQSKNIVS